MSEYRRKNKKPPKVKIILSPEEKKNRSLESKRRYVKNNPQKRRMQKKKYYYSHKALIAEKNRINKDELNRKSRERKRNNPQSRLAHNYRSLILQALKRKSTGGRFRELLGCSIQEWMVHLESLFQPGMTWDNYGMGSNKWCIDHVVVLDSFVLEDYEEAKKAFHYSNTQPMWYPENCSKSNRYNGVFNPCL